MALVLLTALYRLVFCTANNDTLEFGLVEGFLADLCPYQIPPVPAREKKDSSSYQQLEILGARFSPTRALT